jgi:hypothetical protein
MPYFFSINDGLITDPNVFGFTLSSADVVSNTNGIMLSTSDSYCLDVFGDNSALTGVAVQLSSINASPSGTLILTVSTTNLSFIETYAVSSFTTYNNSNNLIASYPLNWQILKFTTPITVLSTNKIRFSLKTENSNQISLLGSNLSTYNKCIIKSPTVSISGLLSSNVIHIGGALNGLNLEYRNISASTISLSNTYIHNGGVLNFPANTNTTLTILGNAGLNITSDGTFNIGTSSLPILSSSNQIVNLINSFIQVHNGGNLNIYGAYKNPIAYLNSNTTTTATSFSTINDISNWSIGDVIIFSPNISSINSSDIRILTSVSTNSFNISLSNRNSHDALNYIPNIFNMTRNVMVSAAGLNRFIRSVYGAKVNIVNTQLNTLSVLYYPNLSGKLVLSGCSLSGMMLSLSSIYNNTPCNIDIYDNNIISVIPNSDTFNLTNLSANNLNFINNNLIISRNNGLVLDNLSGNNINLINNNIIGSNLYGVYIRNVFLNQSIIGGNSYRCLSSGWLLSGNNVVSPTYLNIGSYNNNGNGISISGNNVTDYLNSPLILNINGLNSFYNTGGFEGYNITGNLSSFTILNNNNYGLKISLGNYNTIFDGLSVIKSIAGATNLTITGSPTVSAQTLIDKGIDGSILLVRLSSQYLSKPYDSSFAFGTNDFTIESWVNLTSLPLAGDTWPTNFTNNFVLFGVGSPNLGDGFNAIIGNTQLFMQSNDVKYGNFVHGMSPNNWYHVVWMRKSNLLYCFVDGVLKGSAIPMDINAGTGSNIYVGCETGQGAFFNGRISNLRVINGSSVYPIDGFTPPTNTLLPLINTVFLWKYPYSNSYYNTSFTNIEILSGINYYETTINNVLLSGDSYGLILNSTKFEQFYLNNSILSASISNINITSLRNKCEGSYNFNNCIFNESILSSNIILNYQTDSYHETGFSFMRHNKQDKNHFKITPAGKISFDTSFGFNNSGYSEKLEPYSRIYPLRSSSKLIPVNFGDLVTVTVYVYKSIIPNYTGSQPRLMLKQNSSCGYPLTVLDTSTKPNGIWEKLTGVLPIAKNNGIAEVYVECTGIPEDGYISIDNWNF